VGETSRRATSVMRKSAQRLPMFKERTLKSIAPDKKTNFSRDGKEGAVKEQAGTTSLLQDTWKPRRGDVKYSQYCRQNRRECGAVG